jgi:hypothetical protein
MPLILKRASLSRTSGTWSDDDYDVLSEGACVGRIFLATAGAPAGTPWFWGIEFHRRRNRVGPYQGHTADLIGAMKAFRAAWERAG